MSLDSRRQGVMKRMLKFLVYSDSRKREIREEMVRQFICIVECDNIKEYSEINKALDTFFKWPSDREGVTKAIHTAYRQVGYSFAFTVDPTSDLIGYTDYVIIGKDGEPIHPADLVELLNSQ